MWVLEVHILTQLTAFLSMYNSQLASLLGFITQGEPEVTAANILAGDLQLGGLLPGEYYLLLPPDPKDSPK